MQGGGTPDIPPPPEPEPEPVTATWEPTANDHVSYEAAGGLTQAALDVLSVLPSLL